LQEETPLVDVTRLESFQRQYDAIIETNTAWYAGTDHQFSFSSWEEVEELMKKIQEDLELFFSRLAYLPATISEED
jgi:nicotinic acid mononucleotide adenylyltransferase